MPESKRSIILARLSEILVFKATFAAKPQLVFSFSQGDFRLIFVKLGFIAVRERTFRTILGSFRLKIM